MEIMSQLGTSLLEEYGMPTIAKHLGDTDFFAPFGKIVDNIIQDISPTIVDEKIDGAFLISFMEKPEIDIQNISIPFIFKMVEKDVGKLILALFLGMRIVVTGDKVMTKTMIDSLKIFSPHRNLKKIYWTEQVSNSLSDVIGVPPNLANIFIDSVIIDLEKGKVSGINDSKYFDDISEKIKNLNANRALKVITEKFDFLINKLEKLIDFSNDSNIVDEDLEKYTENLNIDILDVLERFLIRNNPRSIKRIKKTCKFVKQKMSRVVKGFKKQKW